MVRLFLKLAAHLYEMAGDRDREREQVEKENSLVTFQFAKDKVECKELSPDAPRDGQESDGLSHDCCFLPSALAGRWSEDLQLGIKFGHYDMWIDV